MSEYVTSIGSGYNTFTLTGSSTGTVPTPPAGLISTYAVQTKAGWIGQVRIDGEIVFETDPTDNSIGRGKSDALRAANDKVVERIKALFVTAPAPTVIEGDTDSSS